MNTTTSKLGKYTFLIKYLFCRLKNTKTYQTMPWYAIRKCDSIISYICLHLLKATSDFILVLSHKDHAFSYNDFFSSWSALSEAKFVRQTFPREAYTSAVLVNHISRLIVHLLKKAPSGSIVTLAGPSLSRRLFLTNIQNVVF